MWGNTIVNYYPIGGARGATSDTGYSLLTAIVVLVAVVLVVRCVPVLRLNDNEVGPSVSDPSESAYLQQIGDHVRIITPEDELIL